MFIAVAISSLSCLNILAITLCWTDRLGIGKYISLERKVIKCYFAITTVLTIFLTTQAAELLVTYYLAAMNKAFLKPLP